MSKQAKKPMPEFWYNGKPVQDKDKLVKLLRKDGHLRVDKNKTIYRYCSELRDWAESAFSCEDIAAIADAAEFIDSLSDYDDFDSYGVNSIDYKFGDYITINGRRYTWNGGVKKLAKIGLFSIERHVTIYQAIDPIDDYCYANDSEEPLEFLRDNNVYDYFEYHIESCPIDELKKWKKIYDI